MKGVKYGLLLVLAQKKKTDLSCTDSSLDSWMSEILAGHNG